MSRMSLKSNVDNSATRDRSSSVFEDNCDGYNNDNCVLTTTRGLAVLYYIKS